MLEGNYDYVFWIDADVVFKRMMTEEIILRDKTFPIMITFSPSYLIRYPENKKYSWEDLKKIKKKIQVLKIKIQ